jgi:glutamine amidotransferase
MQYSLAKWNNRMGKKSVCILDYGSGNVGSVFNLLTYLDIPATISNKEKDISNATHLILPGVGAFGPSMEKIKKYIPVRFLTNEVIDNKKPFLGICVGMQVLADTGLEFGKHKGLGWIRGVVNKIESGNKSLPHIGWNDINILRDSKIIDGLSEINDFYFVNSFAFEPQNKSYVVSTTNYYKSFVSVVKKNNIIGVQFHPEKSQKTGQKLIYNFMEY